MSSNVNITEDEIEGLINSGGVKEETIKKRKIVLDRFNIYIADQKEPLGEVMNDKSRVERLLLKYLESLRITKRGTSEKVRPKALYFENILSHLKSELTVQTGFDFTNRALFPELYKGINGIRRNIKGEGRGNVRHTPEIPQSTLQAIFGLLSIVQAIMVARFSQNEVDFQENLSKIPENYR